MYDYTGKIIFLGIDVHKRTYSVTAVCEGHVVKQDSFIACPQVLVTYCKKAFKNATIKSAYEAGFCGFVLHRFLLNHDIHNIVVHPGSIEIESNNFKKTDKRDSKKIAVQLYAGRLRCVFIPPVEAENRRYVSRLRETLVKQRTRTSIQLKSFLHLNGLIPPDKYIKVSQKFIKELLTIEFNKDVQYCLHHFADIWLFFNKKIKKVEQELTFLTPNEQELYTDYRKVIGFGPKIARILVQEIGNTMQFSNEDKLFAFCGLTPREHSSGDRKRLGHITRQGNPILRKVLVQAAWVAVRKDPFFAEYHKKLSARKGACRAIVAVARKLIGRARCAIKKKETFIAVKKEDKVLLQEDFVAAS